MATVPAPDDAREPAVSDSAPPELSAWIERDADGREMYTIAPDDAAGVDLMTRWLTVPAEHVCDLTEMR